MRLAVAVLALGLLGLATAQAQDRAPEPSDAQRCLRHVDGPEAQPAYPSRAYNDNRGGRVQVEMRFAGPDRAPELRVLLHEGEADLLEAVQAHSRGLRVPCLAAGTEPAVLRRDYEFAPDRRQVHWSGARDVEADGRDGLWGCLMHTSGRRAPEYPASARRAEIQGRVLARMEFHDPEQPPRLSVHSRPSASRLADVIEDWAKGYRLPCLIGPPMRATFTFVFMLEGDPAYGFREVNLRQFLGSVSGIEQQTLQLDTHQMGCPFELRMQYRQPDMPNLIGEPGNPVPARRPLLRWLAESELDLRGPLLDAIYGDTFKLAVPCLKINLKPKEK
jgi:hypothetical protein